MATSGGEERTEDGALTLLPRTPFPRWANGYSEEKPLSVPRDAPFQLETCPLTAVDALGNSPAGSTAPQPQPTLWGIGAGSSAGLRAELLLPAVLRFFLEYQWFVDFAVYSGGVYVFTEAYYYVLGPAKETNIAVFWCLLTIAFSMYPSSGCRVGVGGGRQVGAGLELSSTPLTPRLAYQLSAATPQNSPKLGGVKWSLFYLLSSWARLSRASISLL